jgi:hypothetical protein
MHEWPVAPLHDSMRLFAHAAFFALRALAAQNHKGRVGLSRHLRRTIYERLVRERVPFAASHTNW